MEDSWATFLGSVLSNTFTAPISDPTLWLMSTSYSVHHQGDVQFPYLALWKAHKTRLKNYSQSASIRFWHMLLGRLKMATNSLTLFQWEVRPVSPWLESGLALWQLGQWNTLGGHYACFCGTLLCGKSYLEHIGWVQDMGIWVWWDSWCEKDHT